MMVRALYLIVLVSLPAHGEEQASCLKCHDAAEDFESMTIDDVVRGAKDTSIMAHKRYGRVSEEEVRAMVETMMKQSD